jgi:hypothetical protein
MPPGKNMVALPGVVARQWLQALCALPQAVWLWRSRTISNTALFTSQAPPTCDLPCALLRAYNNTDPAPKRQKAITPKLLRYLFQSTGLATDALHNSAPAVMADITIAGFFFVMRSCEYSTTPVPGKTKLIILSGIVFRTASKQLIDPTDPILLVLAQYITITFVNQKTGKKMDRRTQQRTDYPLLCPVLCYASVVQCIHRRVPNWTS